jgi:hypothetical protein
LSVTCGRSVVFSGYSVPLPKKLTAMIPLKYCSNFKYQNISQYWYIIKGYVIFHLKIVLKIVVKIRARLRVMVFNATFNNISVVSWRSVFLVEERSTRRKPPTCIWNMKFSLYFFHKRLHFVIYISNTFWSSKSLTLKHLS